MYIYYVNLSDGSSHGCDTQLEMELLVSFWNLAGLETIASEREPREYW